MENLAEASSTNHDTLAASYFDENLNDDMYVLENEPSDATGFSGATGAFEILTLIRIRINLYM